VDCLKIGFIGLGTVGTGALKCLLENRDLVTRQAGVPLEVAGVADIDLDRQRDVNLSGIRLTKNARELIRDPDIQAIVELVGGTGVAREFVMESLEGGKDLVTANKALLAKHGAEAFRVAEEKGCFLGYEGAVCGGIPVIDALSHGISATRVSSMYGIINGTCNYILSLMSAGEGDYDEVLREAQTLGYAEADPSADVDGWDAAHKIAILSSMAFGQEIPFDQVYVEGISQVSTFDIDYARELGYAVKLLAIAKVEEDGIQVRVHPTMIPESSPLASVDGVNNALYVEGSPLGAVMLAGPGAGGGATGNAVASDLIQIARNRRTGAKPRSVANFFTAGRPIRPIEEVECPYYLRFRTMDRPGVIARISGILGDRGISIASMIQHEAHQPDRVPVVLMTHEAKEKNILESLRLIDALDVMMEKSFAMRVEYVQ
jgi:homoserine dehydrogenase